MKGLLWAVWPVGLVLTIGYAEARLVPAPVFAVLDLIYLAMVLAAVHRAGRLAAWFAAPAAVIFSLAAWTGAPTASKPGLMLTNAAVLAAAAVILLTAVLFVAAKVWDGPGREPGLIAVAVLVLGTTVYVANLLARFAVVLSGATPAQVAVEDTAWQAHAYLQGLDTAPEPFTTLLVWLDLLQFAYVLCAFAAVALAAVALHRAGLLSRPMQRAVAGLGAAFIAVALLGAVAGSTSAVGAGIAFALTIPFMSTLLPSLLAAGVRTAEG